MKEPAITKLYKGTGCKVCNGSGYFGRTLVYELLTISQEMTKLIVQEADPGVIAEKGRGVNFFELFGIVKEKVLSGVTTTEEAMRTMGNVKQI